MLHLIQRCTIRNTFERFLSRISEETYLKMDYFGSKSSKIASAGGSAPRSPLLSRSPAETCPKMDYFGS